MRKFYIHFLIAFLFPVFGFAQIAYVPTYAGGQLTRTDLTNANQVPIGDTEQSLGAGDFDELLGTKNGGCNIALGTG